jgi:hypothetical protein
VDDPARSGGISTGPQAPVTARRRPRASLPQAWVAARPALRPRKVAAGARVARILVALGACLAGGTAAGCGGSPASRPVSAPPVTPPPPAAGSTPGPSDRQAEILHAYTGMWRAYAAAARTASYQPGALSQYAAGGALMVLTRSLYDNHQHGVVLRGAPALDPKVTGMTPAGQPGTSSVTDCADDSRWRQYTTSGGPASGAPAGRHRIYAQLRLFGSVWKVTSLVVQRAGTC